MADRITTSTCRLSSSAITTISEPTRVPTTATVPRCGESSSSTVSWSCWRHPSDTKRCHPVGKDHHGSHHKEVDPLGCLCEGRSYILDKIADKNLHYLITTPWSWKKSNLGQGVSIYSDGERLCQINWHFSASENRKIKTEGVLSSKYRHFRAFLPIVWYTDDYVHCLSSRLFDRIKVLWWRKIL